MDKKEFLTLDVSTVTVSENGQDKVVNESNPDPSVDKLEVLQIPNVVTVKHEVERWPDKHRPVLRTLCANFPGNKDLLDKLEAVVDSLHICSDSLFEGSYQVITDVEDVKRLLTEVIIRFDTDPDFYHKEDYQLLISLLYRSLLYLYDRDDASHDDGKNTAEALQGEPNIIYFTQDKHSVVFNGKEYGFTDLSDYATEEWVEDIADGLSEEIQENAEVTASALTDLNERLETVESSYVKDVKVSTTSDFVTVTPIAATNGNVEITVDITKVDASDKWTEDAIGLATDAYVNEKIDSLSSGGYHGVKSEGETLSVSEKDATGVQNIELCWTDWTD